MMANWDLDMIPVKGGSGNAFTARNDEARVFIKKNANPMLTSIYLEGITPRVLWTKRTAQGDMLSAQPWINGHTLTPEEMSDTQINQILSHLHKSKKLVDSYKKLGSQAVGPEALLEGVYSSSTALQKNIYLSSIVNQMKRELPELPDHEVTVVHGDVNHNNWLVDDETQRVYLVDWDTVFLSDPMVDMAYILSHYIKPVDWSRWLSYSGYQPKDNVMNKVAWYGKLSYLRQISDALLKNHIKQVNEEIQGLRNFCRLF
ncbi:phosphotransferase [Lactococcus hircilactis]|uniref:Phosphotransferase n=2 Tax=Lactococcus hircilactis TaxID=1494462 RepID=A0A7X2D104_9LACT|nr:phosphotransferase family protein [Lactococcus hircilactis]MQW39996.1 phosphotransferase [Lactococcus hircilactis]